MEGALRTITPGGAEYWGLFNDFRRTAFRLETLQLYRADSETDTFRAFLAGEPCPPWPARDQWLTRIRAAKAAGKSYSRVHIVTEPLTDYTTYELTWIYPANVAAGEDIRIVPVTADWPPGLPRLDYWLFDSETLAVFRYDDSGRLTAVEASGRDEVAIAQASAWRDTAWRIAIPYDQYMARRQLQRAS